MTTTEEYVEAVHYMKVLKKCCSCMQPEIQKAVAVAIAVMEDKL